MSFKEGDYRARLVWLYRSLVKGAAAHSKWEDAIYWLQELINHEVRARGWRERVRGLGLVCEGVGV